MNATDVVISEAPFAGTGGTAGSGQVAALWQSVLRGFNCGAGADLDCTETAGTMLLELLCVLVTFATSCWGGWLFSQYYFTRATQQVCSEFTVSGRRWRWPCSASACGANADHAAVVHIRHLLARETPH